MVSISEVSHSQGPLQKSNRKSIFARDRAASLVLLLQQDQKVSQRQRNDETNRHLNPA